MKKAKSLVDYYRPIKISPILEEIKENYKFLEISLDDVPINTNFHGDFTYVKAN